MQKKLNSEEKDVIISNSQDAVSYKLNKIFTYEFKKNDIFILIKENDKIIYPTDTNTLNKIENILSFSNSLTYEEIYDDKDDQYYKIETDEIIDNGNLYNVKFIQNISSQKKFEKESKYDKHTNVFNKQGIEEKIDSYISAPNDFSLVVCDIDDFKIFNDLYGHSIGDKVLIEVANVFKKYTDSIGFVGRYGGDEFILIFKKNEDETIDLLNSINYDIKNIKINYDDKFVNPISISCGIYTTKDLNNCTFKDNEEVINLWKVIFNKADSALYESKRTGKKKISVYKEEKCK